MPQVQTNEIAPRVLTREAAKEAGFAIYNNAPHLAVEVPDGPFTITARTSQGRHITFAFMSYEADSPPQCVDVLVHDDLAGTVKNGQQQLPVQQVIVFKVGNQLFRAGTGDGAVTTCLLLTVAEPGEKVRPAGEATA